MHKYLRNTLLLLVLISTGALAQSGQPTDNVYYPGYVAYKFPVVWLVRPDLRPACGALQRNDLVTAEEAFRQGVGRHPDDLAAYLGLLQAARGVRDTYLTDYQQDAKNEDTAPNNFKLGVLALYMFGERLTDYRSQAKSEKQKLAKIAREALERAYDLRPDPIVGFTLADAYALMGKGNPIPLYEDTLKRTGGESVYRAYLHAKSSGWADKQPPIHKMPSKDLLILQRAVASIYSQTGGRSGLVITRVVDGKETVRTNLPAYSSVQKRGMAYLYTWFQRIGAAVGGSSS